MRGEARSTIDIRMARGTWIETIKVFKVSTQIFSNHLPLEFTAILSTTTIAVTVPLPLLPRFLLAKSRESKQQDKV